MPAAARFWRNSSGRAIVYQAVFLVAVAGAAAWFLGNAFDHLRARGVNYGFAFLWSASSVPVSETMPLPVPDARALRILLLGGAAAVLLVVGGRAGAWIGIGPRGKGRLGALGAIAFVAGLLAAWRFGSVELQTYHPPASYGLALATALCNTIKVAAAALVGAMVLGLFIGLCRLSPNVLLERIAHSFVEVMRNVPLLLHIFFWYFGILQTLPGVRGSIRLDDLALLNNRGLTIAEPVVVSATAAWAASLAVAIAAITVLRRWARARRERIGHAPGVVVPSLVILAVAALVASAWGPPFALNRPVLRGFNFVGGLTLSPEYTALFAALALYHAAFVSEIVRSAVLSVHVGQTEAGLSLGLSRRRVLWLIVLPQAQRVAIPSLISTSLGLIKDTSLGVTIGYAELVEVSGTVLDVSGHVLEVILLVVAFYMSLTLSVSAAMNWYNARVRLHGG